ncbi:hypothetical protein FPQ14_00790 [Gilliamella apicola]|uniref:Lambda phage tail tube protein N-terminal domain-containing protein n=1 Tax=Gilliamella apicola TaxID=1196095 RepID=A0A556RSF2_9GAMM|nr:phage tail tube protein [Gilliamella apicola]TSJ91837.1 hypothetical protein FPQ14_00790 [Gilliamella apicola]
MSEEVQSEYTRTRGAGIYVGKNPSTKFITSDTPTLPLECTVTDYSMTAPEGEEIDVSTLSSRNKETISGLPSEGTFNLSVNFVAGNAGQKILRKSYNTGDNYPFKLQREDGSSLDWIARVASYEFKGTKNNIETGSFSLKVKGNFVFNEPQSNQPSTRTVEKKQQ